jgi:class 3 adenylate cyclase/DNA-binding response OmpR family regulator
LTGERILVVDDGQENREFVVEYILEPAGYEALVARDGVEGVEMALKYHPDLILLDLQMPRMNGIQVLQTLSSRNVDIPVILMTFHGSEEIAVEVYRLGVRDYVKKPYSVDEMMAAIERSLTETRLRREKEALTERVIQANRELQLRLQELNVLYSIGKNVAGLVDMNTLLARIVDAAGQITQAEEGYIYIQNGSRLVCLAQKRLNSQRAEVVDQEVNDRIADKVIESGQPLVLTREQLGNQPNTPVSIACVPLILGGQAIGVLGVRNVTDASRAFSKHHAALLSALTDYAAIAIENARNFEALQQTKDRETAQIRNTFKRFVSPVVVDEVLDSPERLQLGGKRREVSILFADIRGYTAYSENAPPEEVVQMLNDYLSLAANVILSYNGTLDKYLGDGLMAIFNAPEEQGNHTQLAAEAALMLQQAAREVAAERGDGLSFSIGVHVGEAVVGYIGTDSAVNYTAVGDVVNLAKRLQEYATPGQVLVEEAVIRRLGNSAQSRPLGEIKFRGRQKNAYAYELQSLAER